MPVIYATALLILFVQPMQGRQRQFSSEFVAAWQQRTLQKLPKKESILLPQSSNSTNMVCQESCIHPGTLYKTIDCAALLYASLKICRRALQKPHITPIFGFHFLCPKWYWSAQQKGNFVFDACAIALETLLYKTVLKLIVLCGTGDFGDVVEHALVRSKKLVTALCI